MFDFKAKGAWPRYFKDRLHWKRVYGTVDLPIASVDRAFVAPFEREVLEAGISVNHMTSTVQRQEQAVLRFYRAMGLPNVYSPHYWGPNEAWINFMVCTMCGASTSHAPVFILDGMPKDFDQRALEEAWMIPAPIDGVMPVVVCVFAGYGTPA